MQKRSKSIKFKSNSNTHPAINHIAIIPDGNRRYAKANNLKLKIAYAEAIDVLLLIVKRACKLNTKYISFFCLSAQNIFRTKCELLPIFNNMISLIYKILKKTQYTWFKNNVKFSVIGSDLLPDSLDFCKIFVNKIRRQIYLLDKYQKSSNKNLKIHVTFAINYGGKEEIIAAIKKAQLQPSNKLYDSFFFSGYLPEVDICIRTGNVKRISNFFLWKLGYAELFFEKCYWPLFTVEQFNKIVDDFNHKRRRKFGK